MLDDSSLILLLRQDLQRTAELPLENTYLTLLLNSAKKSLELQGVRDDGSAVFYQVIISTAAWLYRKRITGEAEPQFLRRMRLDLIADGRARRGANGSDT